MVVFKEELIIESYQIRWLIWIQLLITILLLPLFSGFAAFTYDASTSSAAPPSGCQPAANNSSSPNGIITLTFVLATSNSCARWTTRELEGTQEVVEGRAEEEEDESSLRIP
ncbi:hypothetical protein SASPL_150340 [Salvia splendens]|uniref:Transmembrane protein n=1 Tax=Salvia splendens TaxID=180675 RepID=A0A8X8Z2K7_SALSN|nr:hypothetical protein SASPL_150340 [Salvia splendens]